MGKIVINTIQLCVCTYEAILVFAGKTAVVEIYKQCKEVKIDMSKVIFWEENSYLCGLNQDYSVAEKILGPKYVNILENKQRLIRSNLLEDLFYNEYQHKRMYESDYIRVTTLELVVDEIKDLEESFYSGLYYYYPRLVKGGYIFIHDYNSFLYGVKKPIW